MATFRARMSQVLTWFLFAAVILRGEVSACSSSDCQSTRQTSTLKLTLRGVPRKLGPFELSILQNSLEDAYSCSDKDRNVTGVQLRSDLSVDLSSSINSTFSLVFEIDYTTNLCQDTFFELDNNSSDTDSNVDDWDFRRRNLARQEDTLQIRRRRLRPKNEKDNMQLLQNDPSRRLQTCNCALPSPDDFLEEVGGAATLIIDFLGLLDRGIDDYIRIEEITELEDCDTSSNDWEGTAAWTVNQDLSMVSPAFTEALQQATIDTFNGYSNTCDEQSRRIESVEISVRPVENANLDLGQDSNSGRRNTRWLEDDTDFSDSNSTDSPSASSSPSTSPSGSPTSFSADLFTIVFSINGSCRNCQSDLRLFDQVKEESNRELDTSAACGCAPGKERRGQSADEFLVNLKERLSQIDILAFLASEDGPFAEVRSVGCPAFNSFISFTSVTFRAIGPSAGLSDSESTALSQGFVRAYNNLQATRCDPLFRILDSAQVIGTSIDVPPADAVGDSPTRQRGLQVDLNATSDSPSVAPSSSPSSSPTSFGADLFTIVFLATGTCAGCPSETLLFDQLSPTRRLLDVSSTKSASSEDVDFLLSSWRHLEDVGTCFCRLEDEEGAPELDEFVDEINIVVDDLIEGGELNATLIGTESASQTLADPSSVPMGTSDSPSSFPSSLPSAFPTQTLFSVKPTLPPSVQPSTASEPLPSLGPTNPPSMQPTMNEVVPPKPSQVPTSQPSLRPTNNPTTLPTSLQLGESITVPTFVPTGAPTIKPTQPPTPQPTSNPTKSPSSKPSGIQFGVVFKPTAAPSLTPTEAPTSPPTSKPTASPSLNPTEAPTSKPTASPSLNPTEAPTSPPTSKPTASPSLNPTEAPTSKPTASPSLNPTEAPTNRPTLAPTKQPSVNPTESPTLQPTAKPTESPSMNPTQKPTASPSLSPTELPTRAASKSQKGDKKANGNGPPEGVNPKATDLNPDLFPF